MNFLFLCGTIEPGKDGVGDYTRRLSGELIKQEHSVTIIALNDHYIGNSSRETQESDSSKVEVLRLSSFLHAKKRVEEIVNYIEHFNPDWISLQFVPYSFQKRGLPFGLGRRLADIGKGYKWHIMFHELWIGMAHDATMKDLVYGKLQKRIIRKLVHRLHPYCIHTQTTLYRLQLKKMNINANILPLFSNIPGLYSKLEKTATNTNVIGIVIFGGIHYGADVEGFADWMLYQEKHHHKSIRIEFVGNNGPELEKWTNILDRKQVSYMIHGRRSPDAISQILSGASVGLTTTPFILVEKSGSVAAMLEHHLPVICLARDWIPDVTIDRHSLPVMVWHKEMSIDEIVGTFPTCNNDIHSIARQFINDCKNG